MKGNQFVSECLREVKTANALLGQGKVEDAHRIIDGLACTLMLTHIFGLKSVRSVPVGGPFRRQGQQPRRSGDSGGG